MTQSYTDFSDSPTLTERWNTGNYAATIQTTSLPSGFGTHALRIQLSTSAARYAVSWDNPGTSISGDVEVLAKVQHAHTSDIGNTVGAILHGGGAAGTEDAYVAALNNFGSDTFLLSEYPAGGGSVTHATSTATAIGRNVSYRIRFQRTGTTIRARVWADGSGEPGTWDVTATDATLSSGWIGIWSVLTAGTTWVDWIGVGTGGDAAPDAPIITGIPAHLMRTQHYGPRGLTGNGGPFNG